MVRKILAPVLRWLGYTRRERRASFILLVFIVAVLIFKSAVPPVKSEVREISFTAPPVPAVEKVSEIRRPQKPLPENIELNSADSAKLITLPGIGPVLAGRIIKFRNLLGGFVSVIQLKEVYGLKEETYNLIRDRILVDSARIIHIGINSAGYREMVRHPYLEPSDVKSLLKYRELKGSISGQEVIIRNNLIDSSRMLRVRPYLRYD